MKDYEEYGDSFRVPRAMRDDGGPANNGFQQYDGGPSQTEGRPPGSTTATPAQTAKSPTGMTAMQPQTFTQMQAAGLPRPPAPATLTAYPANQQPYMGIMGYDMDKYRSPSPPPEWFAGRDAQEASHPGSTDQSIQPGGWQGWWGGGPGTSPAPGQTNPWIISETFQPPTGGTQPAMNFGTGTEDLMGTLRDDYLGSRNQPGMSAPGARYTGQFTGDPSGGQLGGATMQSIMQALSNPSRYDAGVVKDSYGYLSGMIDDDYNARDQQLREGLASRGLGAVGDGSIGTGDQRFQNLQRRTAKQNLASELLREQANTYGSDRSSALAAAMGYGNQRFGNELAAFGANQGVNESNFGQDLSRANYGLNANNQQFGQRQTNLQNLLGLGQQNWQNQFNYGQQQYQNQYQTAQMNQQQQYQQLQMLMALLGYGG